VPAVSRMDSTVRGQTTAPAATYQEKACWRPALDSAWMTSGAVPPNVAMVKLYQDPMPMARTSVGNSSLMTAGAIEVLSAYRPRPVQ
jgi:hypothetical protein